MPKAIITGVRGQDGSLLAEHLLENGYEVVGTTRDLALRAGENLASIAGQVRLVPCSYDEMGIVALLEAERPDEVYNLAGQAYVGKSWMMLSDTLRSAGEIPQHFLEAIRIVDPRIRFFQASSSQIYAPSADALDEGSAIGPNTPYGCSKMYAHFLVKSFRETYGLFAVNGIFFNHESPRRDEDFFVQKLVKGVVATAAGAADRLALGNLNIRRDIGCAREFMRAAHLALSADQADDYNICTGEPTRLNVLVDYVCGQMGLDSKRFITTNKKLIRRYEPSVIVGNNEKIRNRLGWTPRRSVFDVVDEMIESEMVKANFKHE